MLFALGLLIAAAAAMGLLISVLMPLAWFVVAALVLGTLQLYTIGLAGVYLSGAHLAAIATWRSLGVGLVWRQAWYRAAVALMLAQGLSAAWSPEPMQAVRQILFSAIFICLVPAIYQQWVQRPVLMGRVLKIALLTTVIEAFLVCIFRAVPGLKLAFLGSPIAQIFVSVNTLGELVGNGTYSISDPSKSGGFFVNANVAAAFLGFSGLLAWGLAPLLRSRTLMAVAGIDLFAVCLTGSKAGLGLAVLSLIFLYAIKVARAGQMSLGVAVSLLFGSALAIAGAIVIVPLLAHSAYVSNSSETLDSRVAIWKFAYSILRAHPLVGLGFGGWEREWPSYALTHGLNPFFPPHNVFLTLFVQSGILAVMAGAAFVFCTLRAAWLAGGRHVPAAQRRLALGIFCGFFWLFIQAQGENFGLMGEVHITPLMAAAMAYLLYLKEVKADAEPS